MAEMTEEETKTNDGIVKEAKDRVKRILDWESTSRQLFIQDIKIANADADNHWQWPNNIRMARIADDRPCLTVNKIRQHNLQIINNAKQNKPGIVVRGTGNGATKESADVCTAIMRHIEYQSNATVAYDTATSFQVQGGIGYWRIVTDYAGDDTFDQEIFIKRIDDPLTVLMDPDIKELDGSDARFCFIIDDVPREEYENSYPDYKDSVGLDNLGIGDDWCAKDHIRVAEYYRKIEEKDELLSWQDEKGKRQTIKKSQIPPEVLESMEEDLQLNRRTIWVPKIEWFLIIGDKVADKRDWPGKYIPVVRLIGEETKVEGQLDRKGHTRAMKDPQRIYNYWTSSAVEHVALQGKTPWVGPIEAFEGHEQYWKNANTDNAAYLPFNGFLEDGTTQISPPQRPTPPTTAPAYLTGMQVAQQELMDVSGQQQNSMGVQGNERTGKAINERQRQGENATYHFIDNLGVAIRFTGKILLDLIPKIYDTERVMNVLAEDGTSFEIQIDPTAQQAMAAHLNHDNEVILRVFNPKLGLYDVQADIGPSYGTQRQEAFEAFTLLLTQAPALSSLIGDIMLRAGDFPGADEAAERLKRMVPKQALGQGPTQQEQMLTQQVQQLSKALEAALSQVGTEKLKLIGKEQMRDIDVYEAETKRLAAMHDWLGQADPDGMRALIRKLFKDSAGIDLDAVVAASAPTLDAAAGKASASAQGELPLNDTPPVQGARQAQDGKWYLPDPKRAGKFMVVA
jgi:hypothetical protein